MTHRSTGLFQKDEDPSKYSARVTIHSWAENAACNGISNIERAKKWPRKAGWILLTLAGAVMTAYQCYLQIYLYFQFRVDVSLNITNSRQIAFPGVTICNINPARFSQMSLGGPQIMAALNNHPVLVKHVLLLQAKLELATNVSKSKDRTGQSQRFNTRTDFLDQWASLPVPTRLQMGHQIEDMLLDCHFNGETCNASDFRVVPNPQYGNCYTFNADTFKAHNVRVTHITGPMHGLILELNIEMAEYVSELTESAGARLAIHDAHQMPFPEDQGMYIMPHTLMSVSIRMLNITRKPFPYPSNCIYPKQEAVAVKYSSYSRVYETAYSMQSCMKSCYQTHVVGQCGCFDPLVEPGQDAKENMEIKPCGANVAKAQCKEDIQLQYKLEQLHCNCPLPCEDILYSTQTSQAKWPNELYLSEYLQTLASKGSTLEFLINSSKITPQNNLIKLEVYFEDLNYEVQEELESYSEVDMLSDVGGLLGFYLGLSVIALFEFLELFLDLLILVCHKAFAKSGKTKPDV